MTETLLKHEGTLDKYDGDAIKAFFGAPLYFKDHSKRACWVAIEMQEKLDTLRKKMGERKQTSVEHADWSQHRNDGGRKYGLEK